MPDRTTPWLRVEAVTLTVRDLAATRLFYETVIGLAAIAAGPESAALGVDGRALVTLREDGTVPARSPRDAGLFHTAFLLPTRADLGRWAGHARGLRVRLEGASDHVVSEAIYLSDPEGNGIEVYADRPRSTWTWSDGHVAMRTDPLDLDALVRAGGPEPWGGAPGGTAIGHVHLQVGAILPAEAFYGGVLGLPVTARYPGGSFFGADGYHHHLAANIWNSRGAPARTGPTTGLADLRLAVPDEAALDGIAGRGQEAGCAVTRHPGRLSIPDPWGTAITVVAEAGA